MATEEQIIELARNLRDKHLVASMEDALERARMILQSVPDSGGFILGGTTADAAGVTQEVVADAVVNDSISAGAQSLPKESVGSKSDAEKSCVETAQDDLSKIKKDLESSED
ncbi:MAG: hypothetical protein Q7K43_03100 [Candidatus Woesearchaeota archaeon]|nr:hypothetical protein [Candidatus Woesearchaeota archaeon]